MRQCRKWTCVLSDKLAHSLAFAVVDVSGSAVDFADLVLALVGIAVIPIIKKIAGVVIAPAGDPIVARVEIEALVSATEVDRAIAVTIVSIGLRPV